MTSLGDAIKDVILQSWLHCDSLTLGPEARLDLVFCLAVAYFDRYVMSVAHWHVCAHQPAAWTIATASWRKSMIPWIPSLVTSISSQYCSSPSWFWSCELNASFQWFLEEPPRRLDGWSSSYSVCMLKYRCLVGTALWRTVESLYNLKPVCKDMIVFWLLQSRKCLLWSSLLQMLVASETQYTQYRLHPPVCHWHVMSPLYWTDSLVLPVPRVRL